MDTEYVRVEDLSTGHVGSIPVGAFDKDAYKKVSGAATDDLGNPLPWVHNEKVGKGKQPTPQDTPTGPVSGPSMV